MTIPVRTVDVKITNPDGSIVFQKDGFEVPEDWSDRAATIVASKYAMDKEFSAIEIIDRVVNQIGEWGWAQGYFNNNHEPHQDNAHIEFKDNLRDILINQRAAFNSPVWFNCGVKENSDQMSACFIFTVDDNMTDILEHVKREGIVFKSGSGAGINISKLRAKGEKLSNKGEASGPISFMKVYDANAGSIKSGGKSRRSAKMVCLNVDHPDIMEFIECKKHEEIKAKALIAAGYSQEEAYATVAFQNANHSIRVTDEFMKAACSNDIWSLRNVGNGEVKEVVMAGDILRRTAEIAWETGDPGIQFDTAMNRTNPIPENGRINSTNPCQPGWATVLTPEGIKTFNDISVGSVIWSGTQWTKITHKVYTGIKKVFAYYTERGTFYGTEEHRVFSRGIRVLAKDAETIDISPCLPDATEPDHRTFSVLYSEYISEEDVWDIRVEAEEHSYWTGGLLVSNCSEFSAIDNSSCNLASINLMKYRTDETGVLDWDKFNKDIDVLITAMDIIIDAADYPTEEVRLVTTRSRPLGLGFTNLGALLMSWAVPYDSHQGRDIAGHITYEMTLRAYERSIQLSQKLGSFEMYDRNKEHVYNVAYSILGEGGIERGVLQDLKEFGIRNSQLTLLAPTGTISFMMDCDTTGIEPLFALKAYKQLAGGGVLEIVPNCVNEAADKLANNGYDIGINIEEGIKKLPDTHRDVFATANEMRWKAHIDMMAACQRHINGAISKTVNMPADCTVDDIEEAYIYAWESGLKALAVYRDGSKGMQPLSTKLKEKKETKEEDLKWTAIRKKLPSDRPAKNHKFDISGFEGYLNAGYYPDDGQLGEIFITGSKIGSQMKGLLESFSIVTSMALQYGVPLEALADKFINSRFDPSGFTRNEDIRMCSSIMDYVFRWLMSKFGVEIPEPEVKLNGNISFDGPSCNNCGGITTRQGTCFVCPNCGETSGCS